MNSEDLTYKRFKLVESEIYKLQDRVAALEENLLLKTNGKKKFWNWVVKEKGCNLFDVFNFHIDEKGMDANGDYPMSEKYELIQKIDSSEKEIFCE